MRAVKGRDTALEMHIRRLLHAKGYRYRLHDKKLPGCPDLVFPSRRKVIFINGCFWHGHDCLRGTRIPKTNTAYWTGKIARNRLRDTSNQVKLKELGWEAFTIWECQIGDERLGVLDRFLKSEEIHP